MNRRHFIPALLVLPAAAQNPETPKIAATSPDVAAPGTAHFFQPPQLAALGRLAELISPATSDTPGAREAGAAEFLDFLLSVSPPDRAALYRTGLDRLNTDAHARFTKTFAELTPDQADAILAPLHQPWSYGGPTDPLAQFLLAAKDDILTATVNSREWIQAVSARRRGAGGVGLYWYPIE